MRLSNKEVLLHWPLTEHVITVGVKYKDGSAHNAIDMRTNFNGTTNQPVYAAEDGTVDIVYTWNGKVTKGDTNSYGNLIKLRHADYNGKKLETLYAHLSKICVKKGEKVKEGQVIGYSGATGNVQGAHLHFEVRWNGSRRNPLCWLDDDFTKADSAVRLWASSSEHSVVVPAADKKPAATTNVKLKGIDVSKYQCNIDWAKVADDGVQFAMIRAVSTNNSGIYVDPYFEKNYAGAKAAGIPVGAYFYTYATDEEQQNEELSVLLKAFEGKIFEYPIAVDVEDKSLAAIGKDRITALTKRAMDVLCQKGYLPMLYTYTNFTPNLDMNTFADYDVWIADYRGACGYSGHYDMWQYSSSGAVNGISGRVDMNWAYKDFPAIIANAGLNGCVKQSAVPEQPIQLYDVTVLAASKGDADAVASLAESLGLKYNTAKS